MSYSAAYHNKGNSGPPLTLEAIAKALAPTASPAPTFSANGLSVTGGSVIITPTGKTGEVGELFPGAFDGELSNRERNGGMLGALWQIESSRETQGITISADSTTNPSPIADNSKIALAFVAAGILIAAAIFFRK